MWKLKPPLEMPLSLKYKYTLEQLIPCDPATLINLKKLSTEEEFPNLAKNQTYMADILTIQMYKRLRGRATQSGFTLDDVIQPGVDNSEHSCTRAVGCVAGDAESYTVFMKFFDPLIELYHRDYQQSTMHRSDLNPENLKGGDDLDGQYVLTCQVSAGRNVDDFCFPPHCSRGERRALEKLAIEALNVLEGEFKGTYHSLKNLSEEEIQRLTAAGIPTDNLISPLMLSSGMARDWPDARGVWHNDLKNFIVWVNKEDHLRFTSMQEGGNMSQVFTRYCSIIKKLEEIYHQKKHPFIWKDYLGYVLTCPSDLGTGLRASVHIRLKYISKHKKFDEILRRLRLEKNFTGSVDTSDEREVWDISNADRIGFSEVQLLQMVVDGIKLLINMDKYIEHGQPIDDLFPTQK
ncbi:creatine kinase M-type-like [Scyliorhinus canicula]|uniref:creatine kinase M-type-like n=1 Tax=Scyliorhinus canicula TaxID=7830 RepID=UPI0018F43E6A|nr:creatine kinase M-type-like [Scyliorhinus canicula]